MTRHLTFDCVLELGLELAGVEQGSYYGAPALKLNGQMLACTPVNKSAEINSAAVAIGFEQRTELLAKHSLLYYVTEHYAPHPVMLVRLSRISRAELRKTLRLSWEFVGSGKTKSLRKGPK